MTAEQELAYLRSFAAKNPQARLRATMERISVLRKAEDLKTALVKQYEEKRMEELAGAMEGLI